MLVTSIHNVYNMYVYTSIIIHGFRIHCLFLSFHMCFSNIPISSGELSHLTRCREDQKLKRHISRSREAQRETLQNPELLSYLSKNMGLFWGLNFYVMSFGGIGACFVNVDEASCDRAATLTIRHRSFRKIRFRSFTGIIYCDYSHCLSYFNLLI